MPNGTCGAPDVHLCSKIDGGATFYWGRACAAPTDCSDTENGLYCCAYNSLGGGTGTPDPPYICETAKDCLGTEFCGGETFCKKPTACCLVGSSWTCVMGDAGACPSGG